MKSKETGKEIRYKRSRTQKSFGRAKAKKEGEAGRKIHILPASHYETEEIKIREIDIPELKREYSVAIRITNKNLIRDVPIPDFIISILSLGKIPVGKINLMSIRLGDKRYEFSIDFTPSQILKLITRHEKFSYLSRVFFDRKRGFITERTHFVEKKLDGRVFEKYDDLQDQDMKDPVALVLDMIALDKKDIFSGEELDIPFEVKAEGDTIRVFPRDEESRNIFSSIRVELENTGGLKLPKFFAVEGLLSLLDVVAELSS